MKILVDINHPAHVHFFRNTILELNKAGHETIVMASTKDVAFELLNLYNIPFINLGTYGNSPLQKALNVPVMALKALRVALKHKPDLMMGLASSRITHAALITRTPTFVFTDTEHAVEQIALFKPFATRIYTPDCFITNLGAKQIRYPSYHELAYLHPERFTPDVKVLQEVGLEPGEVFFVVRFVAWNASHDIGHEGLTLDNKRELIKLLQTKGKVIISSETNLPEEFKALAFKVAPTKIHSLMYYASMYIGEGGTMASEAAVLGTPAIFTSRLRLGYLDELEHKYDMLYNVRTFEDCLVRTQNLLATEDLKKTWELKRKRLLNDKIDATGYMVKQVLGICR
jgi:uncharacterized protein